MPHVPDGGGVSQAFHHDLPSMGTPARYPEIGTRTDSEISARNAYEAGVSEGALTVREEHKAAEQGFQTEGHCPTVEREPTRIEKTATIRSYLNHNN